MKADLLQLYKILFQLADADVGIFLEWLALTAAGRVMFVKYTCVNIFLSYSC